MMFFDLSQTLQVRLFAEIQNDVQHSII